MIFGRKCADFQMNVGIIVGQLGTLVCKNMQMVNGLLGQLKVVAEDSLDQPFRLDLELVPENLAIAVVVDDVYEHPAGDAEGLRLEIHSSAAVRPSHQGLWNCCGDERGWIPKRVYQNRLKLRAAEILHR